MAVTAPPPVFPGRTPVVAVGAIASDRDTSVTVGLPAPLAPATAPGPPKSATFRVTPLASVTKPDGALGSPALSRVSDTPAPKRPPSAAITDVLPPVNVSFR